MFRRVFLFLWLGSAACSGDAARGSESGRLVVTRSSGTPRTLVDRPALARFCERDSTLSIVAVGEGWSAALAMRGAWPVTDAATFTVLPMIAAEGSGAVAVRPLADTTLSALIGASGTITVTPGAVLAGTFDAEVPGDSATATRLSGRFEGLAVQVGACP